MTIPHVCNQNPETTVLAHVGRHGSAKRNHDEEAVYACFNCHGAIDGDFGPFANYFFSDNKADQKLLTDDREWFIARALDRMAGYAD